MSNIFQKLNNAYPENEKLRTSKKFQDLLKKKSENVDAEDLVVHLMNDSPYNHSLILQIETGLKGKEKSVKHRFFCVGQSFEYLKPEMYTSTIYSLTNLNDRFFYTSLQEADLVLIQFLFPFWIDYFTLINIPGLLAWMPWGGDYLGYSLETFFEGFDVYYCSMHGYPINNNSKCWPLELKQKFDSFLNNVSIVFTNVEAFKSFGGNHSHLCHIDYVFPQTYKNEDVLEPIQSVYLSAYAGKLVDQENRDLIKIALGNSSTPENNHFSALRRLKEFEEESNKKFFVTLVLSYGDMGKYKDILRDYAIELFGNRCFVFDEFLEPNDFLNFVSLQDVAYMNHIRSQGFGAINLYLLQNVEVFIKPGNSSYELLRHFENTTQKKIENLHSVEDFGKVLKNFKNTQKFLNKNNLELLETFFKQSKNIFTSFLC